MKLNWKAIILNGIKGGLLLIAYTVTIIFIDKYFDESFFIRIILLPTSAVIFLNILLKIIPKFKGYSYDPDWDIEPGISTIISIIILISLASIYIYL